MILSARDRVRASAAIVSPVAFVLLAPGLCSASVARDVWTARGHPALGLSFAVIGLWVVALLGMAMPAFRRRAR